MYRTPEPSLSTLCTQREEGFVVGSEASRIGFQSKPAVETATTWCSSISHAGAQEEAEWKMWRLGPSIFPSRPRKEGKENCEWPHTLDSSILIPFWIPESNVEHGLSCNSKARIRGSSRIRKVEGEGEARRAKHRHPCDPHQTPRRVDSLLHHSRPCDTPTNSSQLPSQLFCCTSQKGSKIRYIIRQTFTARSALPLQSRDSSIRIKKNGSSDIRGYPRIDIIPAGIK